MADRRPLVEGVKARNEADRRAESDFVYQDRISSPGAVGSPQAAGGPVSRSPLTTRIRADLAQALKRASLQRQLQQVQPSSVQDILEAALEPWLRQNGYLD